MPSVTAGRPAAPAGRLDAVDLARGVAIVAMIGYHLGWDLSFLRLIVPDVGSSPAWHWFARIIAGSFLVLVGVGLVLAHGERLRARAFVRRLAIVGGAALAVTAATLVVFPDRFIFFGILHCIAVSSVLALPFLAAPVWIVVAAAAVVLMAPLVAASPAFDAPPLAFLGLGTVVPATNDYVPLFPWFGVVLAGVALGRIGRAWLAAGALGQWRATGPVGQALAWAGQHSLAIYLTHQIVLIGVLSGLVQVLGRNPAAEAADFMVSCRASCSSAGRGPELCRAACACVGDKLRQENLWTAAIANRLPPQDQARIPSFAQQCFRDLRAPVPLQP